MSVEPVKISTRKHRRKFLVHQPKPIRLIAEDAQLSLTPRAHATLVDIAIAISDKLVTALNETVAFNKRSTTDVSSKICPRRTLLPQTIKAAIRRAYSNGADDSLVHEATRGAGEAYAALELHRSKQPPKEPKAPVAPVAPVEA